MSRFGAARESVDAAIKINPLARRTLRYGIMIELAADGVLTDRARAAFKVLEANFGLVSEFDKAVADLF